MVRIAGGGTGLRMALDSDPAPVEVALRIGDTRYCMRFGGRVQFKAGKLYRARNAAAPDNCG